ncbi:MAG: Tab2/Atab2 family RNA-binding protein [Phormidesmis sp.]
MQLPWQLDFYRRPLQNPDAKPLWELLICTPDMSFTYTEFCPQADVSAPWIRQQLEIAQSRAGGWPSHIAIFRPQSVSLTEVACRELPTTVHPTRATPALKQWLHQRAAWYPSLNNYTHEPYEATTIERPAPTPIADYLMGEQWQFAAINADGLTRLSEEPIPITALPENLTPIKLGLPSNLPIPGVIIDGGRQSMDLAQWLQSVTPVMLQYIPGPPDGLLLEAGLAERWIMATFQDNDVSAAARTFTERKLAAQGLHFLLIRPDDSGMTYTGLWLLQSTPDKKIRPTQAA